MSLPVRERGLKQRVLIANITKIHVAPRAGAWIETFYDFFQTYEFMSLPVRERGLKPNLKAERTQARICRSPCGSVD